LNFCPGVFIYQHHINIMEERDHRQLGRELDLFTFSELVGPGLPLWTPKGTILRQEIDKFIWQLREERGYQRVTIPHITKKELYETSGHWEKFSEELFKINSREGKEYALKPMNCPHHTQIFDRKPHSYREMPQRYAETTMVYRDEQSGELGGLTRVLSITQDDAHVFCRHSQVQEEFLKIWDIIDIFYKTFGFKLKVRLSFRDLSAPEKYLGTSEIWDKAEAELRAMAEERDADFFEGPGEAALYGPKLDFMGSNAAGREWQVATIQLDMNIPERFDLTCINEKGERERIVMVHAAIAGSLERCAAVLIEHYDGAFPLWLAPEQVAILPVSEAHHEYAGKVAAELKAAGIRVNFDNANESLGKKIRNAKQNKIPYFIVIGDKEVESGRLPLEDRSAGKTELTVVEITTKLTEDIKSRSL
jgi:threonyl-tRNA synthetase